MTTPRASTRALVALFFTCTLLVVSESPAVGQATTWKVSRSAVSLLARPTGGATVLASAPIGTTLRLLATSGDWIRVTTSDARGVPATGWVRAQDLRNATGSDPLAASAPSTSSASAQTPVKTNPIGEGKASPLVSAAAAAKTAAVANAPATPGTITKAPASAATAKTPATTTASVKTTPVVKTATPVKTASKTPAPKTSAASTTAARRPATRPAVTPASTQAPARVATASPIVPTRQFTMPASYLIPAQPSAAAFSSAQVASSSFGTTPRTPTRTIVSTTPRLRTPGPGGPFRLMGVGAMSQRTSGFVFEGQMSVRVASWLELTAEGGQLSDVMSPSSRTVIDATAAALSEIAGQAVVVDARAPAKFGMAGARFVSNASRMFKPYVSATGGMAFVTPRVRFVNNGQEITAIAGTTFQDKTNSVMIGVATGVYIPVGKFAALDLGYRTLRGFDHGSSSFSQNQAIFGIGTRF